MGGGAAPRHKGGRRVTRKSASPGLWRGTGAQTQRAALYTFARAGVVIGRARLAAVPLPFTPSGTPAPLCLSPSVLVCCLRPPRCVSTGPEVVRLAGMANEREREREVQVSSSQGAKLRRYR